MEKDNVKVNTSKCMYNEVYEFYMLLGKDYIQKLPPELFRFIESEREDGYSFILDVNKDIASQLSQDALCLIAYLNLKYFSTKEEKEYLLKEYAKNDNKTKIVIKDKDEIFKADTKEKKETTQSTFALVGVENESELDKFKNKVREILYRRRFKWCF